MNLDKNTKDKVIKDFIDFYNKENKENTSLEDWNIEEEEVKSDLYTDKGIVLHFESKEYNEEYDVMDESTREIRAVNFLYSLFEEDPENFVNWDNIGGIESYVSDIAVEDIRDALKEYFESDANEMLSDRRDYEDELEQIAKNYGLNPDDSDFAYDYADARVSDLFSDSDVIAEYIDMFGESEFKDFIFKYSEKYVDMDRLFETILQNDGYGPSLATYDGEELELPGTINGKIWFVYRIN